MIAVAESSRSADREPLEWCVGADMYESFCTVFGPGSFEKYRHIEQAMREYGDLDDHAAAEDALTDLLDSLSVANEKNQDGPEFSMDETYKIRLSVNADLKAAFKQFTHDHLGSKSYGYALTRALREYLLNPRARRLTEKIERLDAALQDGDLDLDPDPDAGDSGTGTNAAGEESEAGAGGSEALPEDARDRLEDTADRMDDPVGETVRDRAAEMSSTLLARRDRDEVVDEVDLEIVVADHPCFDREPSMPTLRRYTALLIGALDLRPHPKHHENHADRFPDGDTDPDVTEYVFPEKFREIMGELQANAGDVEDDVATAPGPSDVDEDPPPANRLPNPAEEMAALEAAETATSGSEPSGETDRGRIMTDGGTPVTRRAPGSATAPEGDPLPDDCG